MGDTYGAWLVQMPNGINHVVVCKAYAIAQAVARERWPAFVALQLISAKPRLGGEVVFVDDDLSLRE